MKKPRVLLADDHQIVLEGLKSLLEREFDVVGSVGDGRALAPAHLPGYSSLAPCGQSLTILRPLCPLSALRVSTITFASRAINL